LSAKCGVDPHLKQVFPCSKGFALFASPPLNEYFFLFDILWACVVSVLSALRINSFDSFSASSSAWATRFTA
jgi:hypothetical protein